MKSKTSLFNRTIMVNLWQRYWVLFAGYVGVLALMVLTSLVNGFQATGKVYQLAGYVSEWTLLSNCLNGFLLVNFLAAPVFAALLYSFLYNPRHTGLMCSLPVKRETVYLSVAAAGLVGMLAMNVLALALGLGVELLFGSVSLKALGYLLLTSALSATAFFGMAALCCMLTGNIFAGPAVYGIFSILAYVVETLVTTLLGEIVFGYEALYNETFLWLSPPVQLTDSLTFNGTLLRDAEQNAIGQTWIIEGLGVLAAYAAVGVVLLLCGLLLYKRRAMETAGDTIAIEILKPVFRLCMTIGSGLVFASAILGLFYDLSFSPVGKAAFIAVMLIIGGLLGYFIAKMLVNRTLRVFDSGWKTMGIYAVCVVLLITAIETNLFGFETHVPDRQDVLEVSLQVYDGNGAVILRESENVENTLKLHQNIIANKDFHEATFYDVPVTEPAGNYSSETVIIAYHMADNSTVSRRYVINYGPDEIRSTTSEVRLLESILGSEEAIYARNRVGDIAEDMEVTSISINWIDTDTHKWMEFYDLSPSQCHELYFDCILPDILDGGMGQYSLILDKEWAQRTSTISVGIDIPTAVNEYGRYTDYIYFDFNVDVTAKRTMAFMEELGINAFTKYEQALAEESDYNDLGRYTVNEDGSWYNPDDDYAYYRSTLVEETTAAYAAGVIGGADGPTAIIVG